MDTARNLPQGQGKIKAEKALFLSEQKTEIYSKFEELKIESSFSPAFGIALAAISKILQKTQKLKTNVMI